MICVPIKNKNENDLIRLYKKAQGSADIVELWFDQIHPPLTEEFLSKIFKIKAKSLIYKFEGNKQNLAKLLNHKIDYIDLDIKTSVSLIKSIKKNHPKIKIILSNHDFTGTPGLENLKALSVRMIKRGADIVKIATTAKNPGDCFMIFSLLEFLKAKKQRAICLCMGKFGKLTRMAGHLFDNYLMYCPLDKDQITASGQLTVKELCHLKSAL